jgi:hypothetical protein
MPGVDYNETFAPVIRLETIRAILALVVEEDWEIQQMDVKGAYLNSDLKEKIYMNQPEGYNDGTARLCRPIKTLYRLKQSGREWNTKLDTKLQKIGFECLQSDPCVYIRKTNGIEIITMWVDDLLLFTKAKVTMNNLKRELGNLFEITDLGEPSKLVGIEITRDRPNGTLMISQTKYIESILEKEKMENANPVTTPLDPNVKLEPNELQNAAPTTNGSYASPTGSLIYAVIGTRPDIAYAVNKLCSLNNNPGMAHWSAAKRVLWYLKGTKDLGLTYTKGKPNSNHMYSYADASFTTNADMTSTNGHVFILNGAAITWNSKRQRAVVQSTAVAEYTSMADSAREIVWLQNLYSEIGYGQKGPTELFGDNQSAIAITTILQYHKRSKHLDIKNHYLWQQMHTKQISLSYCPTDNMTADVLTKVLPHARHEMHTRGLSRFKA